MQNTSRFLVISALSISAIGAQAQAMYVIDSSRAISTVDLDTGVKTPTGVFANAAASTTAGMAYNGVTNTVWVSSTGNDSLWTLDLATGDVTLVGAYGNTSLVMHGLEWDSSTNTLYGMSSHDGGLYTIDTTNGLATLVGTTGLASFHNLGYNSDTDTMFMTNSGTDSSYTIDRSNASVTLLGALTGPTNPNALAYNPNTERLYLADNSTDTLYWIDQGTGVANVIGAMGTGNILGMAWVEPVPEPATFVALSLGGALLLLRNRRK
jgi:DNA-binding beta-propeller fold protein YncE